MFEPEARSQYIVAGRVRVSAQDTETARQGVEPTSGGRHIVAQRREPWVWMDFDSEPAQGAAGIFRKGVSPSMGAPPWTGAQGTICRPPGEGSVSIFRLSQGFRRWATIYRPPGGGLKTLAQPALADGGGQHRFLLHAGSGYQPNSMPQLHAAGFSRSAVFIRSPISKASTSPSRPNRFRKTNQNLSVVAVDLLLSALYLDHALTCWV